MIGIGSDHGGFRAERSGKKNIWRRGAWNIRISGLTPRPPATIPFTAEQWPRPWLPGSATEGIIICGTGIGISITANKVKGIRAALCSDCFSAQATREHNDAISWPWGPGCWERAWP